MIGGAARAVVGVAGVYVFAVITFTTCTYTGDSDISASSIAPRALIPIRGSRVRYVGNALRFSSNRIYLGALRSLASRRSLRTFRGTRGFAS